MADPQFMLHDFRWVLTALASPRFPPCHLPLVDSIIIDRGRPSLWLCLQSDGTVQQKPTASSSSQEIYNAFSAFSLGFPRNKARTVCAVHYAVGLPQLLDMGSLATNISVGFLVATCVQPYSSPQGTSKLCVNLRYEWVTDNAAEASAFLDPSMPSVPVFQYAETGSTAPGESSFKMVPALLASPSIPEDVIARMRAITEQLVGYIHRAVPHERVVKLTTEFSLDDTGQLWLVYTSDVRTVAQPRFALQPPPAKDASNSAQVTALSAIGGGAMLDKTRPTVALPNGTTVALHYWGLPDVESLSHREITELKASPHLHSHMQVIASAVSQLVTGVAMPWAEASLRLRAEGVDDFVNKMRAVETMPGTCVTESMLDSLLPTLASPIFDPHKSLPYVGALGEKLGLWALGVCSATAEWYGAAAGLPSFPNLLRMYVLAEAAGLARKDLIAEGSRLFASGLSAAKAAALAAEVAAATASLIAEKEAPETVAERRARELKAALAANPMSAPHVGRRFLPPTRGGRGGAGGSGVRSSGGGSSGGGSGKGAGAGAGAGAVAGAGAGAASEGEGEEGSLLHRRNKFVVLPAEGSPSTTPEASASPSPTPAAPPQPPSLPGATNSGRFVCSDGVTSMVWAVLGKRSGAAPAKASLILVNDFFDTMGHAAASAAALVKEGAHVLVFNLPGQAFTAFEPPSATPSPALLAAALVQRGESPLYGTGIHTMGRAPSPAVLMGNSAVEDAAFIPNPQVLNPGSLSAPRLPLTAIIAGHVTDKSSAAALVIGDASAATTRRPSIDVRVDGGYNVGPGGRGLPVHADGASAPPARPAVPSPRTLNNEFLAAALQQLLAYLQSMRFFLTTDAPYAFDVVGYGYGANVALTWGARFGKQYLRRGKDDSNIPRDASGRALGALPRGLRSIVAVNAFTHIDPTLLTLLTSTRSVFGGFTPDRPDLPNTYISRFMFSDRFLSVMSRDAAIGLWHAAALAGSGEEAAAAGGSSSSSGSCGSESNPITLPGRLALLDGALASTDLRSALGVLPIPLVLVSCMGDALVAPELHCRALSRVRSEGVSGAGGVLDVCGDVEGPTIIINQPYMGQGNPSVGQDYTARTGFTPSGLPAVQGPGGTAPVPPTLLFQDASLSAEAVVGVASAVVSAERALTCLVRIKCGHEGRIERPRAFTDLLRVLLDAGRAQDIAGGAQGGGSGAGAGEGSSSSGARGGGAPSSRGGPAGFSDSRSGGGGGGGSGGGSMRGASAQTPRTPNGATKNGGGATSDSGKGTAEEAFSVVAPLTLTVVGGGEGAAGSPPPTPLTSSHAATALGFGSSGAPSASPSASPSAAPLPRSTSSRALDPMQALPLPGDPRALFDRLQAPRLAHAFELSTALVHPEARAWAELPGPQDHSAWYGANPFLEGTLFEGHNAVPTDVAAAEAAAAAAAAEAAAAAARNEALAALVGENGRIYAAGQAQRMAAWAADDLEVLAQLKAALTAKRLELDAAYARGELEVAETGIVEEVKSARLWETFKSVAVATALPSLPLGPIRQDNMEFASKMVEGSGDPGGETTVKTSPYISQELYEEIRALPFAAGKAREEAAVLEEMRRAEAAKEEISHLKTASATRIQALFRGELARRRVHRMRILPLFYNTRVWTAIKIQRRFRKRRAVFHNMRLRREQQLAWKVYHASVTLQRVARGFLARVTKRALRLQRAATNIQRVWWGMLGRRTTGALRRANLALREFARCATLLSKTWRMYAARRNYRELSMVRLCAIQLQRWWRGYNVRKLDGRLAAMGRMGTALAQVEAGQSDLEKLSGRFNRTRDVLHGLQRFIEGGSFDESLVLKEVTARTRRLAAINASMEENAKVLRDLRSVIYKDEAVEQELRRMELEDAHAFKRMGDTESKRALQKAVGEATAQLAAEMKFDVTLALRTQQARKARQQKELESEKALVAGELEVLNARLLACRRYTKSLASSLKRNEGGLAPIQKAVGEALERQKKLLKAAEPELALVDHTPALARAAEANRVVIQANSDFLKARADATVDTATAFVRAALPHYLGAVSMVAVAKDLNFAAISETLDDEGARELLGPTHPSALLGAGLSTNVLPDFHTRAGAARLAMTMDESRIKDKEEVDPITASAKRWGGLKTDTAAGVTATASLAARVEAQRQGAEAAVIEASSELTLEHYRHVILGYPPKTLQSRLGPCSHPSHPIDDRNPCTRQYPDMHQGRGVHLRAPRTHGEVLLKTRADNAAAEAAGRAVTTGPSSFMLSGPQPLPVGMLAPSEAIKVMRAKRPMRSPLELIQRMGLGVVRKLPGTGALDPAVEPLGAFIPKIGGAVAHRQGGSSGSASVAQLMNIVAASPGLTGEDVPSRLAAGTFAIAAPGAPAALARAHLAQPVTRAQKALDAFNHAEETAKFARLQLLADAEQAAEEGKAAAAGGAHAMEAGGLEETAAARPLSSTSRMLTLATTAGSSRAGGGGAAPSAAAKQPTAESTLTLAARPHTELGDMGGGLGANALTRARRPSLSGLSAIASGSISVGRMQEVEALLARGESLAPSQAGGGMADVEALKKSFFDYLGQTHDERVVTYTEAKLALSTWPWPRKLRDWGIADVGAWARGMGMGRYVPAFEAGGVDGELLVRLDPKLFRHALGIDNLEHLSVLLHARELLRVSDIRGDVREALEKANVMVTTAGNSARTGAAAQQLSGLMREDIICPDATVLFLQCAHGMTKRVEVAVRTGFDTNTRDERGNTLLHIAAKHGHRLLISKILDMGADINAKNLQGNTPLHFLMDPVLRLHCDPDKKLASLVLGRGGDPSALNLDGLPPAKGVAISPLTAAEERTLLAQEGVMMPLETVSRTHLRHQKVLGDAKVALARATPTPNLAAYQVKKAPLPPWELPEASPMDKSMLERKSSLQAARQAARLAAARAGEDSARW